MLPNHVAERYIRIGQIYALRWRFALALLLGGCVNAEAIKACGEACKDHGGMKVVTESVCQCEEKRP